MAASSHAVDVFSSKPLALVLRSESSSRVLISLSSTYSLSSSSSSQRRRGNVSSRRRHLSPFAAPSLPPDVDDEGATAHDMEVFVNGLSLEYESVWDTKPA
ncbi:hypothetical protein L7F22_048421, partial [Adiantum nelumboides]|nr:hypothetical protein [Adiantum nelumboides]